MRARKKTRKKTRNLTRNLSIATVATGLVLFAASPSVAGADRVHARGELVRYGAQVPEGATADVRAVYNAAGSTIVTLHVKGMAPNKHYGAHAHTFACDPGDPMAAGGHFQHVVGGATDPAYANPRNEIWLDFTTDEDGNGVAQTKVPWQFSPERAAGSVMIHAHHTHTGAEGPAGTAGARLACLTVDF